MVETQEAVHVLALALVEGRVLGVVQVQVQAREGVPPVGVPRPVVCTRLW